MYFIFGYDYKSKSWQEIKDKTLSSADLTVAPIDMIINYWSNSYAFERTVKFINIWSVEDKKYIYPLDLHNGNELAKEYDNKGKKLYVPLKIIFHEDYSDANPNYGEGEFIARYRIRYDNGIVTLFMDTLKVVILRNGKNYVLPKIQGSLVYEWDVNYSHKQQRYFPFDDLRNLLNGLRRKKYWNGWDINGHTDIPEVVKQKIIELLQSEMAKEYGFRPSCLSKMPAPDIWLNFIENPLDANILYLENFIGKENYNKIFPDGCTDFFKPLCQYLKIKPTKGLRRAYTFYPYAIVIYMVMSYIGFKDINVISKFYNCKFFMGEDVTEFVYTPLDNEDGIKIRRNERHEYSLNDFKFFCEYGIQELGEVKFDKQLNKKVYYEEYTHDILRMFNTSFQYLTDEIKHYVLLNDFDQYLHDLMVDETTSAESEATERNARPLLDALVTVEDEKANTSEAVFTYNPDIIKLQCVINGYNFRLVHSHKELYRLGCKMHNCVAGYKNDIKKQYSLIVYVEKNDKYFACIEVLRNEWVIRQALAYGNKQLDEDIAKLVKYWSLGNGIGFDSYCNGNKNSYITNQSIAGLDFKVEELAYDKYFCEMTLDELLAVECDDKEYCSAISERLLAKDGIPIVSPPAWMKFNNEKEYLLYVMPQGKAVIKAAYKDNYEAQRLLAYFYLTGKYYLPCSAKNGIYWLKKSINTEYKSKHSILTRSRREERFYSEIICGISRVSEKEAELAVKRYWNKFRLMKIVC